MDHPKIYFNGIEMQTVNDHKHIGLILNAKVSFASHINDKLSKACKVLGFIKTHSRFLSVKIHKQIFQMYIQP